MNQGTFQKINSLLLKFKHLEEYAGVKLPLRSFADFKAVPFVSRDELRRFDRALSPSPVFNVTATSGSTATRLVVLHSEGCTQAHLERLVKTYRCMGMRKGDLCLNLCSYEFNSGGRIMEAAFKKTGAGVIPFGLPNTPERLREAAVLIRTLEPNILNAYTNQLYDLFSLIGRSHSIKSCIINGEPLFPGYKKQMKKMSGAKIFNNYGSMEFSGFAMAEHPQEEFLRVFEDGLYIEVLDDSGKAAETGKGKIVITDLHNTCMPFIRYILGDVVEIRKKGGKKSLKILGRTQDTLLLQGEIFRKTELILAVSEVLRHPNFFIVIDKDRSTYKDTVCVHLQAQDRLSRGKILRVLDKRLHLSGLARFKAFSGPAPKTTTGKTRHLIDLRKSD